MAMFDAETLHSFTAVRWPAIKEIFTEYDDKLSWKTEENILDVGCGTGELTSNILTEISPANSKIIGADISDEMLNYANNHFKNPRITFKKIDILDNNLWKTYGKEEFTKIFSIYMMHRFKNDGQAYGNIYNLLKPGGKILLITPISTKLDNVSPFLGKVPKFKKFSEELSKVTSHAAPRENHIAYITEQLQTNGFEEITCNLKSVTHPLTPASDVAVLYRLISNLDKALPKELIPEVLEEVRNIVKEKNILDKTEDGRYISQLDLLIVFAKKPN